MSDPGHERVINLISAQLDAASNLLKFAADDLKELVLRTDSIFKSDVMAIVEDLNRQAGLLTSNAAFLQRIDLVDASDDDEAVFDHGRQSRSA